LKWGLNMNYIVCFSEFMSKVKGTSRRYTIWKNNRKLVESHRMIWRDLHWDIEWKDYEFVS
jgi:hypothetical protein